MRHDLSVGVEFGQSLLQFAERNQDGARNPADLEFVRLTHIDQRKLIAAIELRFDFSGLDVTARGDRFGRGLVLWHSAKLLVIDQFSDRAMIAADRALRVSPQLEFTEFHPKRVV